MPGTTKPRSERDIPVLLAYPSRDGTTVKAWCPFCKNWHMHGNGSGHRVAHCLERYVNGKTIRTPFHETGYILRIAPRRGAP